MGNSDSRPNLRAGRAPSPDDAITQVNQAAAFAHELRGLLDGSLRLVGLAQRSLKGLRAPESAPSSLDEAERQLASAGEALQRIAGLVKASMRSAIPLAAGDSIPLHRAVHHAADLMAVEFPDRSFTIEIEIETRASDIPAGPLYTVLLNGLRNAIEASTDRRSGAVTVTIRRVRRGRADRVLIDITDDGHGPPRGRRTRRLFEAGVSTRGSGRGLGLAVCRDIVTSMRGAIALERSTGRGAVLRIDVPTPGGELARVVKARRR